MRTFLQQIAVGMKGLVRQVLATAVIFCCAFSAADSAAASGITSMRIGQGVGSVRIVFDADRKFDYKVFLLNEPKRLVIDTFDVKVSPEIEKYVDKNNLVTKTRLGSVGPAFVSSSICRSRQSSKKPLCLRLRAISAGVL